MEGVRVKVAAIQMRCVAHDRRANVARALELIEEAAGDGAELLVLPESFTTGYYCLRERDPGLFEEAEPVPGPTSRSIGEKAREHGLHIVAPVFERAGLGTYYDTAVLIGPEGEVIGKYAKTHIPLSGGGALEKYYFRAGSTFPVFRTGVGAIGMLICYDRLFPEAFRMVALNGAEIVPVPSTIFPRAEASVSEDWEFIAKARALENGVFAIFVNRAGEEEGREYFGNSLIVDPQGHILARAGFEEGVITTTVDLGEVYNLRRQRFYLRDRRPELYSKLGESL